MTNELETRIRLAFEAIGGDIKDIYAGSLFVSTIVIWAEENGPLATNADEWSFGNGSVGADIGIPLVGDWELYGASFNADIFGTSVVFEIKDMASNVVLQEVTVTSQHFATEFPIVSVPQGTVIGFKTKSLIGSTTDARVAAWLRQKPTIGVGNMVVS